LIPVGFGYGDGDEFFLRGWVWDSETRPRPAPLPSLIERLYALQKMYPYIKFDKTFICNTCHESKQKKHFFPVSKSRANQPFELLHIDI